MRRLYNVDEDIRIFEENEKNCGNLERGHTCDRAKMYNQINEIGKEMRNMLPPIFIVEECEYCKKKKVIRRKGFIGEWVCPA